MNRIYQLLGFILFLPFFGNSQQLPVSATTIMNTPHPVYVNEYYGIGSNALQGIITLNDLNEPSWDVRLIVTIEGEGIKIRTKQNFLPTSPINLTSGIPSIIEGSAFAQYLDVNNVDLDGITAASLNQSGKLPEGIYNFCIEVLDYVSGVPLSLPSCAPAFIFFEPPPVTLQPACEGVVVPSDPQIVSFSWQIAGGASPTIAINSLYQLSVYEVTEEGSDPYFAVANNHALLVYESDFINQTQNQIDFGINTTSMLTPGKQYVYRVRAVDGEGKDIYRNNGFSEWCWFFYGYPHDGSLAITSPADEHIYSKFETKSFVWGVSDLGVPGQEFNYVAIIKELNEGQEKEDAMDANPDWYVNNQTTLNGAGFPLNQITDPGTTYIWQVTAYTGVQEVAKSEIYTFYSAPLVDHFMAGPNRVEVVSISNGELENLSGVGRLQVSANEEDIVEFEFENLNVSDLGGGDYALVDGEAIIDLSNLTPVELTPNIASNGMAVFSFTTGSLNSSGIQTNGEVSWPFPHATGSGELVQVKSANAEFSINSAFQINGEVNVLEDMELELLEPNNFKFEIGQASSFQIMNGTYSLSFTGSISSNSEVKTNDGNPFLVNFTSLQSVHYFEISSLLSSATNYLQPSDGLEIGFMPKSVIIDLSEEQSPEKLSGTPGWKGFYFPEFQVRISPGATDATGQLSVSEIIDFHEDQTNADFWLENEGLNLDYEYSLAQEGITFNGFVTEITGNFNVENNQVSSSSIIGEINIPVIDKIDGFGFEIPVTNDGLAQGYLNEDLTQRDMVFNPYGGENRVDITINRAVFAENERLDLEIDADLTGISALVSGISDFRVYGDNTIGIGSKNGSNSLDTQVEGEYKGFAAYVSEVGASLFNGNYVFSYVAALDMGEDVVGEDGPPLLAISSVEEVGGDVVLPDFSPTNPQPEPAISVPEDINPGEPTLTTYEMFIAINNVIVDMEGYLKLSNNDPTWGTSFRGGINGSLKVPTQIDVGANMIFGDRDGVKFWYFDAYFNDREGLGIPVPPLFNLVAMEGKIYHHMSKNETEYIIDPEMAFGAGLYMQIIDNQTGGTLFAVDAGAEIKVLESGDFTISMSGDGSFLNANRRTAGGGMTSAVGEAIVEEALEAIGPISLTFSVGGGDLTIEAEGLTKGSMDFTKGDLAFGFDAELGSTPGIGFNYSKGPGSLSFNANAAGSFGVGLGLDGKSLSLGIQGTNEGYLDLTYDDVSFATRINRSDKTGTLAFAYGDKSIDFGVETDGGYLNLELSSDLKFETGFNTAGSAYLGIVSGSNEFSLSGDKSTGAGAIALKVDGLDMSLDANTTDNSAFFTINTGGIDLNVGGEAGKSGLFHLAENGNEYDLAVDLESNSGNIGYVFNGGSDYFKAALIDGENGTLSFKHDENEFSLYGNASGTAGGISYADGENEFTINADSENETGDLSLVFPGNSLVANLNMDSSYVNYEGEGLKLGVSGKPGESGYVLFDDGNFMINMGANVTENSGVLKFENSDVLVDAYANQSTGSGSLKLVTSDLQSNAVLSDEEKSINITSGDVSISGSIDGEETGLVSLTAGDLSLGFGGNVEQQRGIFNYSQGANTISVDGEAINGTGSLLFDIEGNKVEATSNGEELSAGFEIENVALSITANKLTGEGLATVSSDGTTVTIGRKSEGNTGTFGFDDGTRTIDLQASNESRAGSININDPEVAVALAVSPESGSINVVKDEHDVTLNGNIDGTGDISYTNGEYSIGFAGDVPNKEGTVSYEKGDFGIAITGNPESKTGSITATKADKTYSGEFTSTSGTLTYENPDYTVSASANTSYDGEASVEMSGNKLTIGGNTQANTALMKYENGGFSIQINNEKVVTLAYNENEVSFSIDDANEVQFLSAGEYLDMAQDASGNFNENFDYDQLQVEAIANESGGSIVATYQSNIEVTANVDFENNGSIYVRLADNVFNISKDGDLMVVGYNSNELKIDANDIDLALENGEYLKANVTNGIAFSLAETEFFLDKDHPISIGSGANMLTFSPEFVQFDNNDNSFMLTADKVASLSIGSDNTISVSPTDIEIQYEDKNIAFGETKYLEYSDATNNFKLTDESIEVGYDGNALELRENYIKATYGGTNSIEISPELFAVTYDEYEVAFGTERTFYYKDATRVFDFEKDGLTVDHAGMQLQVKDELIKFSEGESKSISVTPELVALAYEDKTISFGADKSLGYADASNTFELSEEGLEFTSGDKSVSVSEENFELRFSSADYVSIAATGLSFGYDGLEAEILSEGSFTLTEGDKSFGLTASGLAISDGENGVSLQNTGGVPEIKLQNGEDSFELSSAGFAVEYDGERYAINDEENLKINTTENGYIEVMNNGAKYVEGETELIIGGDDNFLELKNGTKSVALTQDEKLSFVDGNYAATLSKELEIEMTDGERTIGLFTPTHYVTYEQGDYELGIRGGSGGNKPGVDVTAYGHTIYVEGERNEDVTVGVESPDFGEVAFTVDAQKNIETRFINGSSVYGFIKDESGITPILGTEPVPPEAEYLEGSGTVEAMDGPSHLTNSIADEGGGSIRGQIELSFDSENSRFVANAAVAGNSPVCIEGAMALDVSPSRFKLDLGTEEQRIEVYPTCSGFGGGGWLGIESTSSATTVDVGVFVGWRASASVEIGSSVIGAGLSAEASAELGVKATAELYPDFKLLEAGIWLDLYVAIRASYWAVGISGSCTIAEAGLSGELLAKFLETETEVSGSLSGYITVLDIISASFDMSFNTSF